MPFAISSDTFVLRDVATSSMVTYHRNYLSEKEADVLLDWSLGLTWQAETPMIMGRRIEVKRRTCAYGDTGVSYGYSGMRKVAQPWPYVLEDVLARLRADTDTPFNFALANLYPDGKAGIGAHADDEAEIVQGSPIVALSLGAPRDFVVSKEGKQAGKVLLEHGSAVVMWMETQKHYKHALPARKRITAPRVSLTFRHMTHGEAL
jgi:alkylated DNA repair dioxygenase AlkB